MRQATGRLRVPTRGPGFHEITHELSRWVADQRPGEGLLTVLVRHTTASLLIQENADRDVQRDLMSFFEAIAPWDPSRYRHTTEGEDDMPAHIRAAVTQTQLSIPVLEGAMALGTWQGVYLVEHRKGAQTRELALHLLTE